MTHFSIEQIESEISKEVRCDKEGRGFYTIRGAARLAGIDHSGLSKVLSLGVELKKSKLGHFLISQGVEAGELSTWKDTGIPDTVVHSIVEYFAFDAGRYCTVKAMAVFRFVGKMGIRTLSHKLTGWKPESQEPNKDEVKAYVDAVLKQLLEEQTPEKATTWQCRYTKRFWEALENLYGLHQGDQGCASFIKHYIYEYFPKEVQNRLDRINPILSTGTRANRQHQHFDDTLLELLKVQISHVTWLLEASADRKAFKESMKKVKKLNFNFGTKTLKEGNANG